MGRELTYSQRVERALLTDYRKAIWRPFLRGVREYALIRIDGENWEGNGLSENALSVEKTKEFGSWDDWKEANRKGFDCTVSFRRNGRTVTTETENLGIRMTDVTTVKDGPAEIYAALSGDQVVLTDIRTGR